MKKGFTIVEVSILFVIFLIVAFLVAPLSLNDTVQAKNTSRWRGVQQDFHNISQLVLNEQEEGQKSYAEIFESIIENETKESIKKRLEVILEEIQSLIATEQKGKLIRRGVNVAIVGKTNVGKSSLLNALLNYEQAIVTDIEGTTRDIVTGSLEYKGFIFNFFDTAGIRQTTDQIENIGIEKAKKALETCDIVLLVLDASRELDDQDKENIDLIKQKKSIVVLNKCDLPSKFAYTDKCIKVSAKQRINTESLKQQLYDLALSGCNANSQIVLTNARHIEVLKETRDMLLNTIQSVIDLPLDCSALDVRTIWEKLGEITGSAASEDIIDKIFSKFCLGK